MRLKVFSRPVLALSAFIATGFAEALASPEQCRFDTRYDQPLRVLSVRLEQSYFAIFEDDCGMRFIARCFEDSGRCIDMTNRPADRICRIVDGEYSCIAASGHSSEDDPLAECLGAIDLKMDAQGVEGAAKRCVEQAE